MDDVGALIGVLIGFLAGIVILLLLFREVVCWYSKINQRITLLEDILRELRMMSGQPGSTVRAETSSTALEETMVCPSCGAEIPIDSAFCVVCGAKI